MASQPWYRVMVVLLLSAGLLLLYEARRTRHGALSLPAAVLFAVTLAVAWPVADLPRVWLAPTYALAGLAFLAALARWRRGPDVAAVWTWGFAALAILGALVVLPDDTPLRPLVLSLEYRVFVVLLLATAAEVAFEARRLDSPGGLLGASALAMVGVLAAIGMTQPANVQWYTAPTALYLLSVGLLAGRRPYPLSIDVFAHEVALVAGALTLVLPPAEQSFEPGAGLWGLVVLAEGFALLGVGLVLTERWLATPGVLSISGVAVRWLFEVGQTVPYWLTLGIAGLALLGLGLLLLFQREWWERALRTVGEWWRRPTPRTEHAPSDDAPALR